MTKEEKKEYKKRKKELMKFGKVSKILYCVFILAMIGVAAYFVNVVWNESVEYQKASAKTRVNEAIEKVDAISGLDLKTNMIPVKSEENNITYRLYDDNGKGIADVRLEKERPCLIVLAVYKEPEIKSLVSYKLLVPSNAQGVIREGEEPIDSSELIVDSEDTTLRHFTIPAKSVLGDMGIGVPSFKWIEANGLYDISQLSINVDDKECKLYQMEDGDYFAALIADEELNSQLRHRAAYCSEKYANYISNDYPYYSLRSMICGNAPFASRLLNVTLTWYGQHSSVETKDMRVSDAIKLSNDDYMLNVIFNYVTSGIYGVNDEESKLTIYLHRDWDGEWRISELMNNIQAPWITAYSIDE